MTRAQRVEVCETCGKVVQDDCECLKCFCDACAFMVRQSIDVEIYPEPPFEALRLAR